MKHIKNRYFYQPERHPLQTFLFSVSLFAAAVVILLLCAPFASYTEAPSCLRYLLIVAWLLLFSAFAFLVRFGLISYAYTIENGILYVTRTVFGKQQLVCDLSASCIAAVLTAKEAKKNKPYKPRRYHNYTMSWLSDQTTFLYYGTSQTNIRVLMLAYQPEFHEILKTMQSPNFSDAD